MPRGRGLPAAPPAPLPSYTQTRAESRSLKEELDGPTLQGDGTPVPQRQGYFENAWKRAAHAFAEPIAAVPSALAVSAASNEQARKELGIDELGIGAKQSSTAADNLDLLASHVNDEDLAAQYREQAKQLRANAASLLEAGNQEWRHTAAPDPRTDAKYKGQYRFGEKLKKGVSEAIGPLDATRDDDITSMVASGVGTVGSYMTSGLLAGLIGGPYGAMMAEAGLGYAQMSDATFHEALDKGASLQNAEDAASNSGVMGTSMALPLNRVLPIGKALAKLPAFMRPAFGSWISKKTAQVAEQGTVGAAQMWLLNLGENLNAQLKYDDEQGTHDGAWPATFNGLLIGALAAFAHRVPKSGVTKTTSELHPGADAELALNAANGKAPPPAVSPATKTTDPGVSTGVDQSVADALNNKPVLTPGERARAVIAAKKAAAAAKNAPPAPEAPSQAQSITPQGNEPVTAAPPAPPEGAAPEPVAGAAAGSAGEATPAGPAAEPPGDQARLDAVMDRKTPANKQVVAAFIPGVGEDVTVPAHVNLLSVDVGNGKVYYLTGKKPGINKASVAKAAKQGRAALGELLGIEIPELEAVPPDTAPQSRAAAAAADLPPPRPPDQAPEPVTGAPVAPPAPILRTPAAQASAALEAAGGRVR